PAQAAPRRLEPRGRLGLVATPLRLAPLHQLIQLVASVDVARLELEHTRELSDRRVIVAGAPFQARETEADARILGKQLHHLPAENPRLLEEAAIGFAHHPGVHDLGLGLTFLRHRGAPTTLPRCGLARRLRRDSFAGEPLWRRV